MSIFQIELETVDGEWITDVNPNDFKSFDEAIIEYIVRKKDNPKIKYRLVEIETTKSPIIIG